MRRYCGTLGRERFRWKDCVRFGTYGSIAGLANASEDEEEFCDDTAYDEFINGLQECVADDDAVIILEAGNESCAM